METFWSLTEWGKALGAVLLVWTVLGVLAYPGVKRNMEKAREDARKEGWDYDED